MPTNPCRILIVDDSESNRMLLAFLLEELGYDTAHAENGEIAVEKALEFNFDAVFMDINMPVMDGQEATNILRGINFDKPIFACTAENSPEKIKNLKKQGFTDYISKPVEAEDIQKALSQYILASSSKIVSNDEKYQQKLEQLKQRFITNIPVVLLKIERALENKSIADLKRVAHKLKGTASLYGFDKLSTLGRDIELAINKSQLPLAFEKTSLLQTELLKIKQKNN